MLLALSKRVGEDRLLNAIKRYATDWRFKHPSPWDFMASMEASLGEPLDTFWLDWLFGTKAVGSGR
jgi:aminopeptidase N